MALVFLTISGVAHASTIHAERPTGNRLDAPTTSGISDVSVLEDASNTVINLFGAFEDAEDADEELIYTVTENTNPSLFTATTIDPLNGFLTLEYAPNQNGSATLTVRAEDTEGLSVSTSFTVTVTAVNDQPIFTKGADLVVSDDAPLQNVNGWATKISPGADNESSQTVSFSVSTPNTALFSVQPTLSPTGTLTYQPQANTSGIATLTVLMFDDGGTANGGENTSDPQIFTITVSNSNDPPTTTGIADVAASEDDAPVNRSLFAAFNDAEDGAAGLTYTVESISNAAIFAAGSPSIDPIAGTLTLTFAPHAFGTSTVSIRATDSGGLFVIDQFQVTLAAVNDAPSFSVGPNISIPEDSPAQTIPNWATNLSPGPANEASQTLSFNVSTDNNDLFNVLPTINANGLLAFTPMPNASGTAVVTVTLMDSGGTGNGGVNTSAPVNFTITLTPLNDPPQVFPETYLLEEGKLLAAIAGLDPPGVLDNDIDADDDALTAILVDLPKFYVPSNWSFSPNGTFIYEHDGSENLEDTFTYRVSDGTVTSDIVTATIRIIPENDPPVAGTIEDVRVNEDAPDFAISLFDAFEDPDHADTDLTFSVTNVSNPGLFDNLNSQSINAQTGVLNLDFLFNANGTSTVTVSAQDPVGESAQITFDVDIDPVNDAPTMSIQGSIDLDEDPGPQVISGWATNIKAGPDNESNQVVTASISNNNPALFSDQPAFTIEGTNGTLSFTPMPQVGGIAEVTIILSDNGGLTSGGVNMNTYEFAITIRGDNDRPTAIPFNAVNVSEDGDISSINLFDVFDDIEDADSLLAYSIESIEGESLFQNFQITGNPATFTASVQEDVFGTGTFAIRATDTEGLWAQEDLVINILPVNDAPSFTGGPDISLPQNSAPQVINEWATNIQVGPDNEQNQIATFVVQSNNNESLFNTQPAISSDGTLTFEPSLNVSAFGTAQVVVALVDNGGTDNGGVNQSVNDTLNITLQRFNTAPAVNNDNYIVDQGQSIQLGAGLGVLANDVDSEGDALTARLITPPVNGTLTLNSDGSFIYQHNNSRTTNDVFTYVANDGFEDSDVASVTISIQPLNTLFLQEVTVLEDSDSSLVDVRQQLFLPSNVDYTFELLSVSDPTLFSKARVDSTTGIITLVYGPNQNGFASLNLNAIPSEGDPVNATQNITIIPVNDAPIAVEDIFATRENTPFEINVINNDVDFDNDALTIRSFSPPTEGSVNVLSNGSFLYTPPTNFTGEDSFSYVVQDDSLANDEGTVRVTVFGGQFRAAELSIQQSEVSVAYGISNFGEVVGVTRSTDGVIRAFSSEQDLFTINPSEASAANDFGQVVGSVSLVDPDNQEALSLSAARWDTLGITVIGSFDGRSSKAFSINNEGTIVGTSTWSNSDLFRGFIWEEGTLKELETNESNESQAFSINERGQVAGYEGSDAVIWNGERLLQRLTGPQGRAYDVNENNQSVGSIDDGTIKAVYWSETGALTDLHVPGSSFSEAYGINNSRWVVGTYLPAASSKTSTSTPDTPIRKSSTVFSINQHPLSKSAALNAGDSGHHHEVHSANNDLRAFLWQGGALVDLNDIIDPTSGWVLLEARGINNAAQITGVGLLNGEQKAFLLSPTNNKAPSAANDVMALDVIGKSSVDVTLNDSDADGDEIRITQVTQGKHGSVTIVDATTLTYTPGNSFTGTDSFTYVIEDVHGASANAEVSVEMAPNSIPDKNYLDQNYPNPFNPSTTIRFGLSESTHVTLDVFNVIGQHVLTIVDSERGAGNHEIRLDASDLPGGVYIYRLQAENYSEMKKLIVLK
ncbi:MAG: tandem-95 repeat protein [Rhodothermaceae bacterium]|nr:tandem-95 repeat protein [Rhodothermaceae bacterium]